MSPLGWQTAQLDFAIADTNGVGRTFVDDVRF